jgi:DNA-binding IclR family transcriptional regulator
VIQVIVRAGQVLDCFTPARPSFTLTECATLAGLTKSSAYRVLTSLEEIGLVERTENQWRPGPRAVSLAGVRLGHLDLQRETSPRLRALVQPFRAAVAFAVPDGDQMIYVERHESPDPFAPSARLGSRAPIWAGATGRAVLAALSAEERGQRLRAEEYRRLPAELRRTVLREVELAVERGYAVDAGAFFEGVAGVAVALCGARGEPLAAISIIVTPERLTDDEREAMGARLLEIKHQIEATMNVPIPGLAAS